ncbi:GtrA family protein [Candidatus Peribacteria bacterium]|nr:GtrA family protein [Candidatus Peribacteria bacterium]
MRHFVFGRANGAHVQFFRYFLVGGSSAVVDLVAFSVLVTALDFHYAFAAFLAYMVGLAWNHALSVLWVFASSKHARGREIVIVIGIAIGGLLWTWFLLYIMIDLLGIHAVIAKMISQIIVLAWNFGMRKAYVFH